MEVVVADVACLLQKPHSQPKTGNWKHKLAPYPPWSPVTPLNSCTGCWMLFACDGYCEYERERTRVECDCAETNKKGAARAGGGAAELGRRGQRLEDGRWVQCRDCEGKMYFWVNSHLSVSWGCGWGKGRKHREIYRGFWADDKESMGNSKPSQCELASI